MRLIDADALLKEHCSDCVADIQEDCKHDPLCASVMWITEAPTIDPESLRPKGRWEERYMPNGEYVAWDGFYCSVCGKQAAKSNYCPNCGAKMEG